MYRCSLRVSNLMTIYNSETSSTQYYEGGCSMYEMEVGPTQHIY